uniref:UDP-glucuronosyltransferase n=1 Tax=Panagrellus redivivus TaxID=6233 RepID=A0A7E4VZR8_PANRE
MISNARIADTLAGDGHDVTILIAEFRVKYNQVSPPKKAKAIIFDGIDGSVFDKGQESLTANTFGPDEALFDKLFYDTSFFDAFNTQCDEMLRLHRNKLAELADEHFDMLFTEQLNLCGTGLKPLLNITTHMWISSCPLDDHMGYLLSVPTPLSYVPAVGEISVSDDMSFYERLLNVFEFSKNVRSYFYGMQQTNAVYQKHFGPTFPNLIDVAADSALTFVLADEFLDFPRPILHNTIFVGGLGMNLQQTLTSTYSDELQKGKKGVIFFSLGTNIESSSIPVAFKKNLLSAFKHFSDYHFIAKFEANDKEVHELASDIPNVKITNWAPQPEILAHERLSLFITHGGYNSLLEAALYAKPLLLMPIFGDQWRNAQLAQRNKFGRVFDKRTLLTSPDKFIEALNELLTNQMYKTHAARIQKLIKTKPLNSTERFLRYTQFVGDNEGHLDELHIAGRRLSSVKYFNIDIILALLVILSILPIVIFVIISKLANFRN